MRLFFWTTCQTSGPNHPSKNLTSLSRFNLNVKTCLQFVKALFGSDAGRVEIDITETELGCEASLAWEYVLPEELYGYLSGNTQKLDNGNYLITTVGGNGTSLEVSGDGDIVWEGNYNLCEHLKCYKNL